MHQTRTLNATTSLEVYIHNSQGGNPPNPAMKIDENFYLHSVDVLDERITEGTWMLHSQLSCHIHIVQSRNLPPLAIRQHKPLITIVIFLLIPPCLTIRLKKKQE